MTTSFNPMTATFEIRDPKKKVIFKTKSLNRASDEWVMGGYINKQGYTLVGVDANKNEMDITN